MDKLIARGAEIVIKKWLLLKAKEKLLIVTSDDHLIEAKLLKEYADKISPVVDIMMVERSGKKVGMFFDRNEKIFDPYDAIIGATEYSLVTTLAAKRAIEGGKKYVSLPLSTNNEISMLSYDFMTEDTEMSKIKANLLLKTIRGSSKIRVQTELGTDMTFNMKGRKPGFFNGNVDDGGGFSSASIELYIPIIETESNGILYLDGSYGYIGKVEKPFKIVFEDGKIVNIENCKSGKILKDYLESFNDPRMYYAGEFGIGLNSKSNCDGNCYIEDESAYGTFHLGLGRNYALGGKHEASGHFDLVTHRPDIHFDNKLIMDKGKVTISNMIFQHNT